MPSTPPFPPSGQYVASQDPPGLSIQFRIETETMWWGEPNAEQYTWDQSGSWQTADREKVIYFYPPDGFIAHDHSTTPPTATGGTWYPQP